MRVTLHLCMPRGQTMREQFSRLMNEVKHDNRRVIRAMLAEGIPVSDTVGELKLRYVPAEHRTDADGEPLMDIYGIRMMIDTGEFSCGDAAAYEAAVLEEKYGIAAHCMAVAQGDDDMHGVFATSERVVDPTLNFLQGRRMDSRVKKAPRTVKPNACTIQDGRVVCDEVEACTIDERGVWSCPVLPGLSGRREPNVKIEGRGNSRWGVARDGAVMPVRRRGR